MVFSRCEIQFKRARRLSSDRMTCQGACAESVAIGMEGKSAPRAAAFGFPADGLGDPAVQAFDEAVGLWPIGSGQAVIDLLVGADEIERVIAGRPARRV